MMGQDIRKQTGRQIHGQLSASPHGLALGLNPCQEVSCPVRRSNPSQNSQAVAQQIETVAVQDFVGVERVIRLGWHYKTLVLMGVLRLTANLQKVHQLAQLSG